MSHILSAISGRKNHPDVARMLGGMTGSGKDKKPPGVFVVVDDSKSNNSRNNAAINDQKYFPILRSHQQQHRSMITDRPSDHPQHGRTHRGESPTRTGFYHSEADRRWANKNSSSMPHYDMYIEPFAKPYDNDLEMGINRGSRDYAGRRSAPAPHDVWEDEEDYYHYCKYNKTKANRRLRHDGAYYDIKKSKFKKPSEDPDYEEHLGDGRQYWRDIILGVNDGLVSTFLLIAGVVGAGLPNGEILLTALAGTVAGAISMAAGEYIATKTQNEVMDGK